MKKLLGSFLVLIIFLCTSSHASSYKWSSFVAKEKVHIGETIYIKYLCEFDDNGELYIIDFEPLSNDLYDFILLSKDEKLRNAKRTNTYEYILKVKSQEDIEIVLEATMKKTSLDSIVNNTTNHYDDTKFDSIHSQTIVRMDAIILEVLDTPKKLLGSFELQVKKDEPIVKASEPYHLDIQVSGEGNFDALDAIDFAIDNVKVFTQKPTKDIHLDKDGYKGFWRQKFAFVGSKDFRVPSRKIEYFDTVTQEIKTLEMHSIDVKVQESYKKSELLDDVQESFLFDMKYLYYFLTLCLGFLVGKVKFTSKKVSSKDEVFIRKIKEAPSLNTLSIILIMTNQKKFDGILKVIDTAKVQSLSHIKKMILKLLS